MRTSTTDARGHRTDYCYDVAPDGSATSSRGLLTRTIAPSAQHNDGAARPTALTLYDARNRPIQEYPPNGVDTNGLPEVTCSTDLSTRLSSAHATLKEYNSRNELVRVTQLFHDYDANGNATSLRVATTTYEYSATWPGQVTFETPPRGNTGPQPDHTYATEHTYYPPGDPQAGLRAGTRRPLHDWAYFCYDAVGRLVRRSDPPGNGCGEGSDANHHWDYSYDAEDRLLSTTTPPTTISPTVGPRLTTGSTYDAVGNRVTAADARGTITRHRYDARGQLAEVWQSRGFGDPATDSARLVTKYFYDDLGHRQWVQKFEGTRLLREAEYRHDGLGRLREESEFPDGSTGRKLTRTYGYDPNGNRTSQTTPNSGRLDWSYDALNRLTGSTYSNGPSTPAVTYAYDRGGRRTRMNTAGQGDTLYTYDERDRLVRVVAPDVGPGGGAARTVHYNYDMDGHRLRLTYPNGDQLTYSYDAAGRLTAISDWAQRETQYTYWPRHGRLQKTTNVDGTWQTRDYDNIGRLVSLENSSSAGLLTRDTITLDPNGNPTINAGSVRIPCRPDPCGFAQASVEQYELRYQYDRTNSLTRFEDPLPDPPNPTTISYEYDGAHNVIRSDRSGRLWTSTLDQADRLTRLEGTGPSVVITYSYDDNGNNILARAPEYEYLFSYDIADRAITVNVTGITGASFAYDGAGLRVRKTVGGTTYRYQYDRAASVPRLLEDGSRRYVHGLTGVAYTTDLNGVGAPQLVFHLDQQGSVRAISNPSGQLVYSTRYEPHGWTRHTVSNSGYQSQPLGYVGAPFDPEASLVYLHARYYAPTVYRFLQRDSLFGTATVPVSLHRYAYAHNNPLVYTDPSGHDPWWNDPDFATPLNWGCGPYFPGCLFGLGPLNDLAWTLDAGFTPWLAGGIGPIGRGGLQPGLGFQLASAPPLSGAALHQRVMELHGLLAPGTQRHTTTAAVLARAPDGTYAVVIANSEGTLRGPVRMALGPNEIMAVGQGHAETIALGQLPPGWQALQIAASRPYCTQCWTMIQGYGATPVGPWVRP